MTKRKKGTDEPDKVVEVKNRIKALMESDPSYPKRGRLSKVEKVRYEQWEKETYEKYWIDLVISGQHFFI